MNEFDVVAYVMGKKDGKGNVVIDGSISCADPNNDGNVVITED